MIRAARARRAVRWVVVATTAVAAVLAGSVPAGAASQPAAAPAAPLATFKILILIYPQVRVPGQPEYTWSAEMLTAARTAAQTTWPKLVADQTNGQVRLVPTVVVSDQPLRSNERMRRGNDPTVWPGVWPEDVPDAVSRYLSRPGEYDSVAVWDAHPEHHAISNGGGAILTPAKVTWYTLGGPRTPAGYGYSEDIMGGMSHEWLHGLSQYYTREKGLRGRGPVCAGEDGFDGVHCGEAYGYMQAQNGWNYWHNWYKDFYNGTIANGTKGLGPQAWAQGVPRARFGGPLNGDLGDGGGQARSIVGVGSNRCVDVDAWGTSDGSKVQLWDCFGNGAQAWVRAGQTFVNPNSGKCLDVEGRRVANGTRVWLWTCITGNTAQQWTVEADGTIRNPASGRCLDAAGSGTANGTRLILWDCHGGSGQRWVLR